MALKLGDMLVRAGMISKEQLDEALKYQVIYGGKLGTNLIELGYLEENDIAKFLSSKLGTRFVPSEELTNLTAEVLHTLPINIIEKYKVIPVALDRKRLTLAMADPTDFAAIDEISFMSGYTIIPVVTPEISLVSALERYYKIQRDVRYVTVLTEKKEPKKPASAAVAPAQKPAAPVPPQRPSSPVAPPQKPVPPAAKEEVLEEAHVIEAERRLLLEAFTIDDVSKKLAASFDRDEIAEIIAEYAGHEFDHAALFILKGQTAVGWKAIGKDEPIPGITDLNIPLGEPSILKTVAESRSFYLGPIPETPQNGRLLLALGGGKPSAALLVPIIMMGKVVNILYVDGGKANLSDRLPDIQRVIGKAVMAFDILILRNKIIMT